MGFIETKHVGTFEIGQELFTYRLDIDWHKICSMALKAASSKGDCSVDGPVRVVVTSRRRV